MAIPPELRDELGEVAGEADSVINHDQTRARALAERELGLYRTGEAVLGHRLHKGHALHNLGAAILGDDPELARTHFHAAFIEDVRTDPREPPELAGSIARQTLAEMFGETRPLLARLEARARSTTTDPLELARAFEAAELRLPAYRGFRRGWRTLDQLDGIPPSSLVFVAGAHALPDRMLALRQAVIECGLGPVVVAEFEDFTPNGYLKSETLMRRCGAVVLDVSYSSAGYTYELAMAKTLNLPRWAGYVAWSAGDAPHAWDMTAGLMEVMALDPVATTDDAQMLREAAAWLRGQTSLTPAIRRSDRGAGPVPGEPYLFGSQKMAAGTAFRGPFANGSNTDFARHLSNEPVAVPSGWGGVPEVPFDPTIEVPRYKLVDGKLVREDDPPTDGILWVRGPRPKEE